MKRHIAALEGIDQNEVVRLFVPVEIDAPVALQIAHARRVKDAEIFFRRGEHTRIDLNSVDSDFRHEAAEIGRHRAATKPEHQHALDLRRVGQCRHHHLRVLDRQVVRIGEVCDGLGVVLTFVLERKGQLVVPLADEDVVVLGFKMRDAAVLVLEHLGAGLQVDQVLGAQAGRGEREDCERKRGTLEFRRSDQQQS